MYIIGVLIGLLLFAISITAGLMFILVVMKAALMLFGPTIILSTLVISVVIGLVLLLNGELSDY